MVRRNISREDFPTEEPGVLTGGGLHGIQAPPPPHCARDGMHSRSCFRRPGHGGDGVGEVQLILANQHQNLLAAAAARISSPVPAVPLTRRAGHDSAASGGDAVLAPGESRAPRFKAIQHCRSARVRPRARPRGIRDFEAGGLRMLGVECGKLHFDVQALRGDDAVPSPRDSAGAVHADGGCLCVRACVLPDFDGP